jgi:hypothetical protein
LSAHSTPVDQQVTLDSRVGLLEQLAQGPALVLPPGLPFDTWAELVRTLQHVERNVQWWLGDAIAYGTDPVTGYGELAAAVLDVDEHSTESVRNYTWVAQRIPPVRRSNKLSWSHHQAVASLDPPDQDRLLRRAEDERMSSHHLRAAARKVRDTNGHAPEPVHVHDFRCIDCGERLAD